MIHNIRVQNCLLKCIDLFFRLWPQPLPSKNWLKKCKIVSHRGEHDNCSIYENTFQAFDLAYNRGIWGIEFDIRWTKDLYPVVIHDPDLNRVFGIELTVADVSLKELQSRCPLVPLLSDVIQRYSKQLHFMVEIKAETYPNPDRQNRTLEDYFSCLQAQTDFHLMSQSPEMFDMITFLPTSKVISIAMLNMSQISEIALKKDFGGVAGHYFLLNNAILAKHHKKGQKVGTGYPSSKNCLFREINRCVEWIFSDNAGKLQEIINTHINTNMM